MNLQPHEVALNHREQDNENLELQFQSFRLDAIFQIKECLKSEGDLADLINTLDLNFDEIESLSNGQINGMILEAMIDMSVEDDYENS